MTIVTGPVQQVPPQPSDSSGPPSGRRWGRWLLAGTVAWALLLAGLTYLSARNDGPTVREQRSLEQAGPVVDRAIGALVAGVGDAGTVELMPPRVAQGCRITPFLRGATLERAVVVRVGDADSRPVLDRIADGLPASYRAGVRLTDEGPRLRADAGDFVAVEGALAGEGLIRLTADTGCRPVGAGYTPPRPDPGAEQAALERLLRAYGQPAVAAPEFAAAPCPTTGRSSRTVHTTVEPAPGPGAPATVVGPLAGPAARVTTDSAEVYAFRAGALSTVVELTGTRLRLTVTTDCTQQ